MPYSASKFDYLFFDTPCISNTVNDKDEWSEFISEDIKETSQNVSGVENAETETRMMIRFTMIQMMSGAKQLKASPCENNYILFAILKLFYCYHIYFYVILFGKNPILILL